MKKIEIVNVIRYMVVISFVLVFSILFLGCNRRDEAQNFILPKGSDVTIFEVSGALPEKNVFVVTEITDENWPDSQAQWSNWRKKTESRDLANMYAEIARKDKAEEEEENQVKEYCESLHSNSCLLNLKEICDHNGCRRVKVECIRFRASDHVCVNYDIEISEN